MKGRSSRSMTFTVNSTIDGAMATEPAADVGGCAARLMPRRPVSIPVTVKDDDGNEVRFAVTDVDPALDAGQDQTVDEGTFITLDPATFTDPGFDNAAGGTSEDFSATIDWGDGHTEPAADITLDETPGSEGVLTTGTIDATHAYADNGVYTVTVTIKDDHGNVVSDTFTVTVNNVDPTLDAGQDQTVDEGTFITLDPATFTDPGFDNAAGGTSEDFTATIDWGDGHTEPAAEITLDETPGSEGVLTTGTIDATHAYADNGVYTVTVTVKDDDGNEVSDTFAVTVNNVDPALDAGQDQTVDEGTFITLDPATFTDPGFDNAAGGTSEDFTATIDWGDGHTEPAAEITLDETPGSEGVLTTGTIDATHAYADNGVYTVTVTVKDDDGNEVSDTFAVTVNNVDPALDAGQDQTVDEGTFITLDPATFTDPGFDNAAGGTSEDFSATIDWGDGHTEPAAEITLDETPGSEGVLTTGTIDATHAYADNGVYTVTVTVKDDDGNEVSDTFAVTVNNVDPALDAGQDQTVDEGTFITLDPATFTDPGFDNAAGGTSEDFTATIDWGDGHTEPAAEITLDETPGSEGVLTTGTIDATHAYADNGVYTVTVTVKDDDGNEVSDTFAVTVNNVDPALDAGQDQTVDEGTFITLDPATFTDPGFDNAAGGTSEDFSATIDWGDAYADNGVYTVTVTVKDDDGNEVRPFAVTRNRRPRSHSTRHPARRVC